MSAKFINKKNFKILLCIPPAYQTDYPTLGTPTLVAFLKSKGVTAVQRDLNFDFFEYLRGNKLEFISEENYKNSKINDRIYYYRELINKMDYQNSFERIPGSSFEFTERMLSSKRLLRYIDDDQENIFHKFFKAKIYQSIKREKFDMVGLSVIAPSQVISAFTFGRIIKSKIPNIKIVIGGQWVSLFRGELIKRNDFNGFYDYAIFGEGETPLYLLIDSIRKKESFAIVPNLIYKEKNKFVLSRKISEENLNMLPCPDFDGLPLTKYHSYTKGKSCPLTFETSRGCYWGKCTFCVDLPLPVPRYREKNTDLLIRDIKQLKRKYEAERIIVSNPVFSHWHMEKFCKELIERRIKVEWWAYTRFEKAITKTLLRLIKKAGCIRLGFGFETISQRILNLCNKGTDTKVIKRIVKDALGIKLPLGLEVIFGLPGETAKDLAETICFLFKLKYPAIKPIINEFYLPPKNSIFNNPKKYGISLRKDPKLPFRFLYPFHRHLSSREEADAKKILEFFYFFRNVDNIVYSQKKREIILKKINFNTMIKNGKLICLGRKHERSRRYDKALPVFKKLLRTFPDSKAVHFKLGYHYFNLNKYAEAIKEIQKAIELGYRQSKIYMILYKCYEKVKGYELAIKIFKEAKKLNPYEPQLNFLLAKCYRNIGKETQANREVAKVSKTIKLKLCQDNLEYP